MKLSNLEAHLELSEDESNTTVPNSILNKWHRRPDSAIDFADQAVSHRKIIRVKNKAIFNLKFLMVSFLRHFNLLAVAKTMGS